MLFPFLLSIAHNILPCELKTFFLFSFHLFAFSRNSISCIDSNEMPKKETVSKQWSRNAFLHFELYTRELFFVLFNSAENSLQFYMWLAKGKIRCKHSCKFVFRKLFRIHSAGEYEGERRFQPWSSWFKTSICFTVSRQSVFLALLSFFLQREKLQEKFSIFFFGRMEQYVQLSCVCSNLFYCSDNVDLAKRDARLCLALFFVCSSSLEVVWKVAWEREKTCLLQFFGTSGVKVEQREKLCNFYA